MSLLSVYHLRYDNAGPPLELRQKITTAVAKAAVDIMSEAPATAGHAERRVWALGVLASGPATQEMAERMLWGVLGTGTIAADGNDATDGALVAAVAGLVNHFAGV